MTQLRRTGGSACLAHLEARCGGLLALAAGPAAFPEPGTPAAYPADRGCEILRIDLELEIEPEAGVFQGTARLRLAPLRNGAQRVELDLDDVEVSAVQDGAGRALAFRHGDGRLRVLAEEVLSELVVRYQGRPQRGLYFTGPTAAHPHRPFMAWTQCQDQDAHFLVPCQDQPGVKHPWGIVVTVRGAQAESATVVSNGRLVAREGARWRWEQAEPMPAYLLSVIVGPLQVVEDRSVGGVPVRYLVPERDVGGQPTPEADVRRIFGRTPAMIEFLATRLGTAFPWPRYDQIIVHDFIFGGMENVAATTLTDVMLTDARAALDVEFDDLVVHELMHQWFGDLVTCQDWSQGWLNEGWATFSEQLWKEHAEGLDRADLHAWTALSHYLDEDGGRYRRAIVSRRYREPIDVFDRHLYEKGSLVLRTLRAELGEPTFWAGVRDYLQAHAHQAVHTLDFQRAMERVSGRSLERFFGQWVLGAGHPELEVSLSWQDGLLRVQVEQAQAGGAVQGDPEHVVAEAFAFDLPVRIHGAAGVQALRLPVRQRVGGFSLPMAEAPLRVEVDPRLEVLATIKVKAPRDWLVASLQQGEGIVGRIRAARALAEEGSPLALKALEQALVADPFYGVRAELCGLLGKRGGPRMAQALRGALADTDPRVRKAAVEAIGASGGPEEGAAILALARDGDPSVQVEGAALVALGERIARADRGEAVLPPGESPDGLFALLVAAMDRPAWAEVLRQRALDGLARTGRAEALPLLIAATGPAQPDRVRAVAAMGLGRLAETTPILRRAAVDRLMATARDPSWRLSWFSLQALGGSQDRRALGLLHEIHATALEGRLRRTAFEAARRLAASGEAPLQELRDGLEKARRETQELRDRLEKLEAERRGA